MSSRTLKYSMIAALGVFLVVGGLVLYPRFADGTPGSPQAGASDTCGVHGVPEARCPFCHPGLIEELGGCSEHGVPEALCYQCRRDLLPGFKSIGDWCAEHGVPESQCPL